uniref:Putative secreted protein n=1 Tax=Anopheles darlingi TaxID=43151 RepID=A0A2M4DBK1_ANODA
MKKLSAAAAAAGSAGGQRGKTTQDKRPEQERKREREAKTHPPSWVTYIRGLLERTGSICLKELRVMFGDFYSIEAGVLAWNVPFLCLNQTHCYRWRLRRSARWLSAGTERY